jgi:hypothetical protein
VLRHERHGRNARKLADEVTHPFHLLRPTAVHGYEYSIHRPLSNYSHGLRNRVAVQQRKTAASRGIHPGSLDRQENRGYRRRTSIL